MLLALFRLLLFEQVAVAELDFQAKVHHHSLPQKTYTTTAHDRTPWSVADDAEGMIKERRPQQEPTRNHKQHRGRLTTKCALEQRQPEQQLQVELKLENVIFMDLYMKRCSFADICSYTGSFYGFSRV